MVRTLASAAAVALLLTVPRPALPAEEPVDLEMVTRIREEGLRRSRVMETLAHLTDVLGPRLTASPQGRAASEWTRRTLAEWGLADARLESYPFGRGWSMSRVAVHMVSPHETPLLALPQAWTPGTEGPVRGQALRAEIASEKDFEKHRGQLAGKIVFLNEPAEVGDDDEPLFARYSAEELEGLTGYEIPAERAGDWRSGGLRRWKQRRAVNEFLVQEKVLATVSASSRGNGIIRVMGGGSWEPGESVGVPSLVMSSEHYNHVLRLLEAGTPVELEIDVAARFHDEDTTAANTVAEIPGTDPRGEVVMVGAHLDSWHGSTGTNDNAAGCAVAMEAMRILKTLGVKPRRTIRIALWTGEEQGLLGSAAYVREHFATRPPNEDPDQKDLPERYRATTWPLILKPGHAKLAAYYNLDNGSGKIRGIYAQENAAVKPIFEAWLAPFADLGAEEVTLRNTGSTDHASFDRVGLPGFQFIQDPLDYRARTHHTNLDSYDHARREDLMQASVVIASFLYHTAMRPELLPRKPLPQEPERREKKEGEAAPDDRDDR